MLPQRFHNCIRDRNELIIDFGFRSEFIIQKAVRIGAHFIGVGLFILIKIYIKMRKDIQACLLL